MLKELRLENIAPWKQRFRAPTIEWTQLAKAAPNRGLVVSNPSGADQLYAWDVPPYSSFNFTISPAGSRIGFTAADAGGFRLLATTNRTGVKRPLIWNPRSSERIDLPLDELDGEVIPLDWSADANRIMKSSRTGRTRLVRDGARARGCRGDDLEPGAHAPLCVPRAGIEFQRLFRYILERSSSNACDNILAKRFLQLDSPSILVLY